MNMKTIFAAIAVTAAGSAAAGDIYPYVDHSKFTGTRTRAEVQAELERDYAQGKRVADHRPEFVEFTHAASSGVRKVGRREAIASGRAAEGNARTGR